MGKKIAASLVFRPGGSRGSAQKKLVERGESRPKGSPKLSQIGSGRRKEVKKAWKSPADRKADYRGDKLIADSPSKYERWTDHQKGFFADKTTTGVRGINGTPDPKYRTGSRTYQWKKGRVLGAAGLATAAAGGIAWKMNDNKKKKQQAMQQQYMPQQVTASKSIRPYETKDYDRPDVRYKDRRYDKIDAEKVRVPGLNSLAFASLAGPGTMAGQAGISTATSTLSGRNSRGKVTAQSTEGAGPGGVGRHFGMRRRSMVREGKARRGQEDAPFKVVPRSDKEKKKDRVREAAKPLAMGGAAAGALYAASHPKVQDKVKNSEFVREAMKTKDDPDFRAAMRTIRDSNPTVAAAAGAARKYGGGAVAGVRKHPRRYAAGAALLGGAMSLKGALEKPDTHKIVFDPPKSKDKAKTKAE